MNCYIMLMRYWERLEEADGREDDLGELPNQLQEQRDVPADKLRRMDLRADRASVSLCIRTHVGRVGLVPPPTYLLAQPEQRL